MLLDASTRISKNASYSIFNSHQCFGMVGFTLIADMVWGSLELHGCLWSSNAYQALDGRVYWAVWLLLSHALLSELSWTKMSSGFFISKIKLDVRGICNKKLLSFGQALPASTSSGQEERQMVVQSVTSRISSNWSVLAPLNTSGPVWISSAGTM